MNYLASPPLVVAYALAGTMDIDLNTEPLGTGTDGKPVFLQGHLADAAGGRRDGRRFGRLGDVQEELRERVRGRRALAARSRCRRASCTRGTTLDLRAQSAVLRGHDDDAGAVADIRGARVLARARRLDHHRPHLAGRQHRQGQPGRPSTSWRRACSRPTSTVRRAPRQPRGDDARHVRQHPPAQPAAAGHARAASRCTCPTASRCRSTTRP